MIPTAFRLSSVVSEKTGCSYGFRVNQYKHLCAISQSLISLNSVLIFVYWYKQPIVFAKQPIVFLVLLFWQTEFLNQLFLEIISFLTLKFAKTLFKQFTPSSLKPSILTIDIKSLVLESYSS